MLTLIGRLERDRKSLSTDSRADFPSRGNHCSHFVRVQHMSSRLTPREASRGRKLRQGSPDERTTREDKCAGSPCLKPADDPRPHSPGQQAGRSPACGYLMGRFSLLSKREKMTSSSSPRLEHMRLFICTNRWWLLACAGVSFFRCRCSICTTPPNRNVVRENNGTGPTRELGCDRNVPCYPGAPRPPMGSPLIHPL